MLTVNRKGLHPYQMANRVFVLAFSNDPVPISLDSQDRRWMCIWSHAPRMTADAAARTWDWYKAGGFAAVGAWLKARDVSAFNPGAAPMMTEFKLNLVEHGIRGERIWPGEDPSYTFGDCGLCRIQGQ